MKPPKRMDYNDDRAAEAEAWKDKLDELREEFAKVRDAKTRKKVQLYRFLGLLYKVQRNWRTELARHLDVKRSAVFAALLRDAMVSSDTKTTSRMARACRYAQSKKLSPTEFKLALYEKGGVDGLARRHANSKRHKRR
jgi:hypothetical protein